MHNSSSAPRLGRTHVPPSTGGSGETAQNEELYGRDRVAPVFTVNVLPHMWQVTSIVGGRAWRSSSDSAASMATARSGEQRHANESGVVLRSSAFAQDDGNEDGGYDDASCKKNAEDGDSGEDKSNLLESDEDAPGLDDALKEEWARAVKDSSNAFDGYTAWTAKDTVVPASESQSGYEYARNEVKGAISMMTGHLEQSLRSMSRCRVMHGRDRGALDKSRLAVMAKSLDKNVFTSVTKGISLDVAVSLLIDESGSIGYTCYDFRRMAVALCECLDRLGIKFEVLGHTTHGNSSYMEGYVRTMPMTIYEHKRFDQSYRSERFRVGSIGSEDCNVDGEALLLTAKRLFAQKHRPRRGDTRFLAVLSVDGYGHEAFRAARGDETVDFCPRP